LLNNSFSKLGINPREIIDLCLEEGDDQVRVDLSNGRTLLVAGYPQLYLAPFKHIASNPLGYSRRCFWGVGYDDGETSLVEEIPWSEVLHKLRTGETR